ncbi:MAG: HAD family hydrolase [Patescibacteria group bacterium]
MKKKLVIGFDLFGTLIGSTYNGPKYYELLGHHARGFSSEYVAAAIRGQVMQFGSINWSIDGERMWDQMDTPDEEWYRILLRTRLGACFDQNPNMHDLGDEDKLVGVDPEQVIRCWKAENEALAWLPGAEQTLSQVKDLGTLVLATNITIVGRSAVYDLLPELSPLFRRCYWSCDLPAAKPDPYVWQRIQQDYPADQYWMIGDNFLIDLAIPAAMGWQTILVGKDGVPITQVPQIIKEGP